MHMTTKQKLLKLFYPVLMKLSALKTGRVKVNQQQINPATSLYNLKVIKNNGEELLLKNLQGKKILLVNTASDCGYTDQYEELQKLSNQYENELVVLGFPANDFKQQEKGSATDIASFCKVNYGIDFPLMKKSVVVKGPEQNEVFNWLSDADKNGWNDKAPVWNFSKYLVNEQGILTHYFDPSVSPLSKVVTDAIG